MRSRVDRYGSRRVGICEHDGVPGEPRAFIAALKPLAIY
uniref:Uncharacterized protein n=1 Tax=Anguilla anguilla TaxID=7936 RepID=A0A0E9QFJ6_ANGAN